MTEKKKTCNREGIKEIIFIDRLREAEIGLEEKPQIWQNEQKPGKCRNRKTIKYKGRTSEMKIFKQAINQTQHHCHCFLSRERFNSIQQVWTFYGGLRCLSKAPGADIHSPKQCFSV